MCSMKSQWSHFTCSSNIDDIYIFLNSSFRRDFFVEIVLSLENFTFLNYQLITSMLSFYQIVKCSTEITMFWMLPMLPCREELKLTKKLARKSLNYSTFTSSFSVIALMSRCCSMNFRRKPWSQLFFKQRKSSRKLLRVVGQ